ncbi:MAG: hypothetical protein KDJ72_13745 [Methyloceanibacter sp.]|uniref:hypothetical protein n=1 Tax=Methyloceanibacter sp. TaxID=1965321 RepID=UPI001D284C1C|nr:hypothetical protein [Methyloceanibacter sp.]MCB1444074.1 hypothetical protein [Methyloceanibacter sp.]
MSHASAPRSSKPRVLHVVLLAALALAVVLAIVFLAPRVASAEPTDITVRVLSKDAKFVGSSMGGARVVLRDADTGKILAEGVTEGGTGDTGLIMHEDRGRRATLSTDDAAKFTATIDIDEPRLVEVEVFGPLGQRQSANRVTATQWVVPGEDITGGDGWLIELPGYVVDVLAPPAHLNLPAEMRKVELRANVTLMCGCPITPGGLWDARELTVKALVTRNGEKLPSIDLEYGGAPSQFTGSVSVDEPGLYDVTVYAHNPRTGNTGLDRTTFTVSP